MRTNSNIKNDANAIYTAAMEGIKVIAEVKADTVAKAKGMPAADGLAIIGDVVSSIENQVIAANNNGVSVPKFLSSCVCVGTTLDEVVITVKSRLKAVKKFKQSTSVKVDENFIINAGKAYLNAAIAMFYQAEADANIEELNAKIAGVLEDAGVDTVIAFECKPENSNLIVSIEDKKIVFNASLDSSLRVSDQPILQGGDEYNDYVAKKAADELVEAIKAAQTTPLIVKAQLDIVKSMTGVSTKKRVVKLIRNAYHKQAKHIGEKAGIGYVLAETDGKTVFGIVAKDEEGKFSPVLSAFDIETCASVDVDICTLV